MANFTTQITDSNIIQELPDVSILTSIYDNDLTLDALKNIVSSVALRKKLQSLLNFKLSEDSFDSLKDVLKQGYKDYETADGKEVTESGGNIFVDGKLIAFNVDGFAEGLFEDETFSALFFTADVLDIIFNSNDSNFKKALFNNGSFWDKLLTDTDLTDHIATTYPDDYTHAIQTAEKAYVKIVANKAGLDFTRYKDLKFLAEDTPAMTTILEVSEAAEIEQSSIFGVQSRMMFIFSSLNLDEIAENDDTITTLDEDEGYLSAVLSVKAMISVEDSKMFTHIINNDENFGVIASKELGLDSVVTVSNIFFDDSLVDVRNAFVRNRDLVRFFGKANFTSSLQVPFKEAILAKMSVTQKYSALLKDGTLTVDYADDNLALKQLLVSLSDFSETKVGSVSKNNLDERVFSAPVVLNNGSALALDLFAQIVVEDANSLNLYTKFTDYSYQFLRDVVGHVVGITEEGKVISSKFVTDINIGEEEIQSVSVTENAIIIRTSANFYFIGNLGEDKQAIVGKLAENKDALSKAVIFNGIMLALDTDGKIQKVTKDGLEEYTTTSDIVATDIFVLRDRLIVLTDASELKEVKIDATIVDISAEITDLRFAQDIILCKVSGEDRFVFTDGENWLKYDFSVNAL